MPDPATQTPALPDLPWGVYVPIAAFLTFTLGASVKYLLKWMRDDADKRDAERSAQRKEDLANQALLITVIERSQAESAAMRTSFDALKDELEMVRRGTKT